MMPMLEVSARCLGNDECRYHGQEDMEVEIAITNRGMSEVGFPLAALQQMGPIVRLVNRRTGREFYVPRRRAPPAPWEYRLLQPSQTAILMSAFYGEDLVRFGGRHLDVTAEFTVLIQVKVGDSLIDFEGGAKVRFVGDGAPKR